jgi:hypothetical protein
MEAQEVRWDKDDVERAENYTLCYGRRNKYQKLRRGFFVRKWMISEIERVKFFKRCDVIQSAERSLV